MIGIVSISKQGNELASRLSEGLPNSCCYTLSKWQQQDSVTINGRLSEFCAVLFEKHEALIFIMATGIVVRSIAPWIKDKSTDPAIVVVDDKGLNVISLLSGHLGGANKLTLKVAFLLDAHPVITTASDVNDLPSVDMLAQEVGLIIDDMGDAKTITAMIVNGENVELHDAEEYLNPHVLPCVKGAVKGAIFVSNKKVIPTELPFVKLLPRNIILGVGCKKNTDVEGLWQFIASALDEHNIDVRSVLALASISIKSEEEAILKAAASLKCDLQFFETEALKEVDYLFKGSAFVLSQVGVASVSTTAAYLAGGQSGVFITQKEIRDGMTLSIFEKSK